MADLHLVLKHLKEENKQLKDALEDQDAIATAYKLENEMLKARLAKLGDLTTRQELRARIICAMFNRNPNIAIDRRYIDQCVDFVLSP